MASCASRHFRQFPDPAHHDNLRCLERDITELAAHIYAAIRRALQRRDGGCSRFVDAQFLLQQRE